MNLETAIEKIRTAKEPENPVLKEMVRIVKTQTHFGTEKFNMQPVVEERGVDKDKYLKEYGTYNRSEQDAVIHLASKLQSGGDDEDLEMEILIAEAEAEALILLLKLGKN